MKSTYPTALLLLLSSASAFSTIQTWEWSGALNFVSDPLSGQFSAGQTFTVRMNVDVDSPYISLGRQNSYTSTAYFNPITSATVTINDWYTAEFNSGSNPLNVTFVVQNVSENGPDSYNDELRMTFEDRYEHINAPEINTGSGTFAVNSINFNISGPVNMIVGSGAAFPEPDAPMVIPGINFFPGMNTNGPENFVIQFKNGNDISIIQGTFNSFYAIPEPTYGALIFVAAATGLLCWRRRSRSRNG